MPTENPDLNPERPNFSTSVETQTICRYLEEHAEVGALILYNDVVRLFHPTADDAECKERFNKLRGSLRSARNALVREKQIHFHCITGKGICRSNDHQIVGSVKRGLRTAHRKVKREGRDLAIVQFDQLDSGSKTETLVLQAQIGAASLSLSFSTMRKLEHRVLSGVRLELSGDVLQLFREQRC
jgi:hypothetical protein